MSEEVEELLQALDRVERYIRYMDMRASGDTYVAWGLAVAAGSFLTFLFSLLAPLLGTLTGPAIGISWFILMALAIFVSGGRARRLWALMLVGRSPEERARLRRSWRIRWTLAAIAWAGVLGAWGYLGFCLLGGFYSPGPLWSLYLACVGLGNALTYLIGSKEERRREREMLVVAASLLACSPLPLLLALLGLAWASFIVAVMAVVASYLWAGLSFYGKAEAILAGEPEG